MKLPEYPLPDGLRWVEGDGWLGATDGSWWYGWVRYKNLIVATEKKAQRKAKEHGKFESVDAACKFISAYLLLGDTDD
jgi:hypothetical protein